MRGLIIPIAALALTLGGCASAPTVFQPAAGPKGVGFSDYPIEQGRYRITYRGGPGAPAQQVSDYALLRAAELALAGGYDWFRVVERSMHRAGSGGGPRLSVGTGGADFGRRSAVGVGIGTSFDLGGGPALAETIEVLMGKGPKPREADVYDARQVKESIGPRAT